jgi:hypothetical protein
VRSLQLDESYFGQLCAVLESACAMMPLLVVLSTFWCTSGKHSIPLLPLKFTDSLEEGFSRLKHVRCSTASSVLHRSTINSVLQHCTSLKGLHLQGHSWAKVGAYMEVQRCVAHTNVLTLCIAHTNGMHCILLILLLSCSIRLQIQQHKFDWLQLQRRFGSVSQTLRLISATSYVMNAASLSMLLKVRTHMLLY